MADRCRQWIKARRANGVIVYVPEIARYEVRRELFRVRATKGLERLDDLCSNLPFLPLTSAAIDLASELWAHVRRADVPTASPDALDADAILGPGTRPRRARRPGHHRHDQRRSPGAIPRRRRPGVVRDHLTLAQIKLSSKSLSLRTSTSTSKGLSSESRIETVRARSYP